MNPLSERLMFNKNDATIPIDFHTDKNMYRIREKVVSTLSFPEFLTPSLSGRSGKGHLSIAITDNKDVAIDESVTILSTLLLSSELKGYIENPAYYLQDPFAMDLLMMTHGCRRYNIPKVVQGQLEYPQTPFQRFQTITGSVETLNLNRPVRNCEILNTTKGGGVMMTSTNENGIFNFQDLVFPDSTTIYVQALTERGDDNVRLIINQEPFPSLINAPTSTLSSQLSKNTNINDESSKTSFAEKAEQRAKYEEELWTVNLTGVEVSASRIVKKFDPRLDIWVNSSSDNTVTREMIEEWKFPNVSDYFALLPSVMSIMR
jgi:hypothetical protein